MYQCPSISMGERAGWYAACTTPPGFWRITALSGTPRVPLTLVFARLLLWVVRHVYQPGIDSPNWPPPEPFDCRKPFIPLGPAEPARISENKEPKCYVGRLNASRWAYISAGLNIWARVAQIFAGFICDAPCVTTLNTFVRLCDLHVCHEPQTPAWHCISLRMW